MYLVPAYVFSSFFFPTAPFIYFTKHDPYTSLGSMIQVVFFPACVQCTKENIANCKLTVMKLLFWCCFAALHLNRGGPFYIRIFLIPLSQKYEITVDISSKDQGVSSLGLGPIFISQQNTMTNTYQHMFGIGLTHAMRQLLITFQ